LHPVGEPPSCGSYPPPPPFPCDGLWSRTGVVRRSTTKPGWRTIRDRHVRVKIGCRPCKPVSPPTKAADLTGDWHLVESTSATTCDADTTGSSWERLWVLQRGPVLSAGAAGLPFCTYEGTLSGDAVALDAPPPSSGGFGPRPGCLYAVTGQLRGTVVDTDHVAVMEHLGLSPIDGSSCAPCETTRSGTLVRRNVGCENNADCVIDEACSRCVDGACEWARGCDPP
jgi:hypothetical protein